MTREEAIEALVAGGWKVVHATVHPKEFGLLEWAEIVAHAMKRSPAFKDEMIAHGRTVLRRMEKAPNN